MRDLYATTIQLVHVGGGDAFDVASARSLEWAWRRLDGDPPVLVDQPRGRIEQVDVGVSVDWTSFGSAAARAVELRLQHPHEGDPSLFWQASAEITETGGATSATIRLSLGASVYSLRPLRLSLRAPSLVRELMNAPLLAYAGTMELDSDARIVAAKDAGTLVDDVLKVPGRALPVLVAASGVDVGVTDGLARGAAGLVQVARAQDDAADEALRGRLAKSGFTIPRRGMRLFWPGFGSPGEPSRNPYWTPAELRAGGGKGSVLDRVVRLLAPISTARVPLDRGALKARQEALRLRQQEQRQREEAQRNRARRQREAARLAKREQTQMAADDELNHYKGRVAEMEALLDLAETERDEANARAQAADQAEEKAVEEALTYSDRVETLEVEVVALQGAIKTMNEFDAADDEDLDEGDPIPEEIESWGEVAEHLPDLEGPGFVLTPQAEACADGKSRYPHPGEMWRSLRLLETVGRAFNELGAELGMRFEQFAIEKAGLDVALQDGSYVDTWFEFEGQARSRLPHVKVDDAKSPNEVGRIYFAIDSDGKRVIVDWFGTKGDRPETKKHLVQSSA